MHDFLFREQQQISAQYLSELPLKVGLRREDIADCVAKGGQAAISRDAELARTIGLTVTPFFLAGVTRPDGTMTVSKYIIGARPLEEFTVLIDGLLRHSN